MPRSTPASSDSAGSESSEDADPQPVISATHGANPQTPKGPRAPLDGALLYRSPRHVADTRPPWMKRKIKALIGYEDCLIMGLQHSSALQIAHCLHRELETSDKELFFRLQDKIGLLYKTPQGLQRFLFLESSDNQDSMCSLVHSMFDGKYGYGSGPLCLVPLQVAPNLSRIGDNPQMSSHQWFPERVHLYRVHIFEGEGSLTICHRGPVRRTYEHLDSVTAEQLEADEVLILADECTPDFVGVDPNDPTKTVTVYTIDPGKPFAGYWIVRSHLNPANVLADTMIKLRYRKEKFKGLHGADKQLYRMLWPTLKYWFVDGAEPLCSAGVPPMPVADHDMEELRRSERLYMKSKTDPAKPSASRVPPKKRPAADTAPASAPSADPRPSVKRKRSVADLAKPGPSQPARQRKQSTAKATVPAPEADSSRPVRQRKPSTAKAAGHDLEAFPSLPTRQRKPSNAKATAAGPETGPSQPMRQRRRSAVNAATLEPEAGPSQPVRQRKRSTTRARAPEPEAEQPRKRRKKTKDVVD